MTAKNKIEKYVKNITKNDTYAKYLTEAAQFGYDLSKERIKELESALNAYRDIEDNPIELISDDDFGDYLGR